ncbi:MAG: RsmB/NOP family class I SAM-dependent RNA methyltransferase [Burkholderiales bacterium]|jgi:16S rRNA (cytosine967-C5)-methyltransferase|nr:RsmB/NOP family class I SAM-dependent RNA methyltransferase [Burkholderiales bacterium]
MKTNPTNTDPLKHPLWRASHVALLARAIERAEALTEPADLMLRHFFRENPAMGQKDRALIAEGVFAYLRRRRSTNAMAQTTRWQKLALLTLTRENFITLEEARALAQSVNDRAWVSGLPERFSFPLTDAENADVPDVLWALLNHEFDQETVNALSQSWQKTAPFDLRVNTLKTSRDEAFAALKKEGFDVEATPYSPFGLRLFGRPALAKNAWLVDGRLEVQSEGSQLIGLLTAPKRGEMVADFCAGAGGKTLLLGMLMRSTGRLYAFDVSEMRLQKLSPRLKRSGLSNVHPQRLSHENDAKLKRLAGKMDRVLVDAPCSGTGTFQRNPDLKWKFSEKALAELNAKQKAILMSAARLVKPGGRLVYATCSVLQAENEAIVEAFLKDCPMFSLESAEDLLKEAKVLLTPKKAWAEEKSDESKKAFTETIKKSYLKLYPHLHHTDGFFAAVMRRR